MRRDWIAVAASCTVLCLAACESPPVETVAADPQDERNARFLQAIRDAGFLCESLIEATAVESVGTAWRVLCADTLVYVATVDAQDKLHVEPIPYGDPHVVTPRPDKPDLDTDVQGPDP